MPREVRPESVIETRAEDDDPVTVVDAVSHDGLIGVPMVKGISRCLRRELHDHVPFVRSAFFDVGRSISDEDLPAVRLDGGYGAGRVWGKRLGVVDRV